MAQALAVNAGRQDPVEVGRAADAVRLSIVEGLQAPAEAAAVQALSAAAQYGGESGGPL